jgi:hypothetical protein
MLDLEEKLAWLGLILEARQFPLDRYAHSLELLAQTVRAAAPAAVDLAARLESGATFVRSTASFVPNAV